MLVLYVGGGLVGVILAAWLAVTAYFYYIHYKYSHIPSPLMRSFYMGHVPEVLEEIRKPGVTFGHLLYKWYQDVGPIFVWFAMHRPEVIILNPDDIKAVCTSSKVNKSKVIYKHVSEVFGQRFAGNGILSVTEYDTWKPRRRIYDPAFNKGYLKGLIPVFNGCVDDFLNNLRPLAENKTPVPMKVEFSTLTLSVVTKVAFSSKVEVDEEITVRLPSSKYHGKMTDLIALALEGLGKTFHEPFLPYLHPFLVREYREAIRITRRVGRECIMRRIDAIDNGESVPNDILTASILKTAEANEEVDVELLVDDFVTFYIAGSETTANLLAFTLAELHQHPDVMERVTTEIKNVLKGKAFVTSEDLEHFKYTEQVFQEVLRLYPPALAFDKEAPKGLTLSGYKIPEGTIIKCSTFVCSRVPEYFEDPLVFNPSRFDPGKTINPFTYFPFGLGHRSCIGKTFAMMEAKVILSRLLQTFTFTLPEDYKLLIGMKSTLQPENDVLCTFSYAE